MATNKKIKVEIVGFAEATKEVKVLTDKMEALNKEFASTKPGTDAFRKLQREITETSTKLDKAQRNLKNLNGTKLDKLKGTINGLKEGFGNLASNISNSADGTGMLEDGLGRIGIQSQFLTKALQRVGAGAGGVVTALVTIVAVPILAYFTKSAEGSKKLSAAMATVEGAGNGVVRVLAEMGKTMVDALTGDGKALDKMADKLWKVRLAMTGIVGPLMQEFKDMGKTIDESMDQSKRAAELERKLKSIKLEASGTIQELQNIINTNNELAGSEGATLAQKENAVNTAIAAEAKLLDIKKNIAEQSLAAIKATNAANAVGGKTIEMKQQEKDLENEISDITTQRNNLRIKANNAIYAAAKDDADREKDKLERTKDEEKYKLQKRLEEASSKEEILSLTEQIKKLEDDYYLKAKANYDVLADTSDKAAALLSLGKEKIDAEREYESTIKATNKAFDDRYKNAMKSNQDEDLANYDLKAAQAGLDKDYVLQQLYLDQKAVLQKQYLQANYNEAIKVAGLTNEELKQLEKKLNNDLLKVDQDLQVKTTAINDQKKADAQKNSEELLKIEQERAEKLKAVYTEMANAVTSITDMLTAAAVGALDARMEELDTFISEAEDKLSGIDDQLQDSRDNINTLEDELFSAKGEARLRIIQQLEQERKKEEALAKQRRAEDERIKKAEKEKIRLEQEKEKAIAKQVVVNQALQAVQTAMVGVEAVRAGIKASQTVAESGEKGKFGWDNIAIIVATTAALIASFASMKNAAKGFAEGGYTGNGGKYEEAGVVHKGEYVIPQWMVKQNSSLISALETQRTRGYAEGGMVAATIAETANPNTELVAEFRSMKASVIELQNRPIFTVAAEVADVNARVSRIQETALK